MQMKAQQPDRQSRTDSRASLSKQRIAEARNRIELLKEEQMLREHLADFWDPHFDKPKYKSSIRKSRFTYAD
jgi:hypothetical protein